MLIWLVFLQWVLLKMKSQQKALFQGRDGKSLEQVILAQERRVRQLEQESQVHHRASAQIGALAKRSLHKTGLIRFNPFKDIGGDQSFSVAFLDDFNDGIVISSLYSRDGVRVYAKAISQGKSEKYPLTEEEEQAIKRASLEKVK